MIEEKKLSNEIFSKIYFDCYKAEKKLDYPVSEYFSTHNLELWNIYWRFFNKIAQIPVDQKIMDRSVIVTNEFFSSEKAELKKVSSEDKYELLTRFNSNKIRISKLL